MNLSSIDLKLLRVFHAVVECGGFTNAQALLNISPSTISSHMSQLESRVGFRLCERGRGGFRLTQKGEQFHRHVLEFFGAVHALESSAQSLRASLSGHLNLGIIDNLVSDPACPLHNALAHFFQQPDNDIHLNLQILSPQQLERGVLDQELDAGIGIFYQKSSSLDYRPLYRERDVLVCHCNHPLAELTAPHELARVLPQTPKVARNFMQRQEFPFVEEGDESIISTVSNVEAAAFLILNGPFIGFLPRHYARSWLEDGTLVALFPEKFVRYSQVSLVLSEKPPISHALNRLIQCLELEHPEPALTKQALF